MNKIKIVADSTCDLSEEELKQYDISIIPLCIVLDMESLYDKEEIVPDQLYEWADKHKKTPKTAAPGIEKAIEILKPFVEEGRDIIYLGISEEMSTTCNVIRMVKEELEYDRIFVIDSMNLSTGIGLQVIRAAQLAAQGKSAEEIVADIEEKRQLVRASFVVDTMEYLARGGRCSSVTALLATTLKIKPMIEVSEGKMGVGKKYRGNIDKALLKYAEDKLEEIKMADPSRCYITHSGCDEALIQMIYDKIAGLQYFNDIVITRAGGVISSHCGPGTLGILFYSL